MLCPQYVADAWLGRYWTIVTFSSIYLAGLAGVVLCTGVAALNSRATLMAALYVVALGTGGIKANVSSFGADQFDDADPAEAAAKSRYFNAFYFTINVGALIASLLVVNVQSSVGWLAGYSIPAASFAAAFCLFLAGTPLYVHVQPRGSPFSRLGGVLVAAAAKWRVVPPADPALLYESDSEEEEEGEEGEGWSGPDSPLTPPFKYQPGRPGSAATGSGGGLLKGGRGWRTMSAGSSRGAEPGGLPPADDDSAGAEVGGAVPAGGAAGGAGPGPGPAPRAFSTHGTEATYDEDAALAAVHHPPMRLPPALLRAALRAERRASSVARRRRRRRQ